MKTFQVKMKTGEIIRIKGDCLTFADGVACIMQNDKGVALFVMEHVVSIREDSAKTR